MKYLAYIVFGILLIVSCFLENIFKYNKKLKIILLVTNIVAFSLLGILKSSNVGIDSKTYENLYLKYKSLNFNQAIIANIPEVSFYGLFYLFSKIGLPYLIFKILVYSIIGIFLFFSFKMLKNSIFNLGIYLFIGAFSLMFSAIRQGIGMAIVLFALIYLSTKKHTPKKSEIVKATLLIFLAATFHTTSLFALVCLPFFYIKNFKFREWMLILLLIPLAPLFISSIFIAFLKSQTTYTVYDSRMSYRLILYVMILLLISIPYIPIIYNKLKLNKFVNSIEYDKTDFMFLIFGIFCIFLTSCNSFSQIFARTAFYFIFFSGFFIDKIFESFKNNKISFVMQIATLIIFFLYFLYDGKTLGVIPYEFI